MGPDIVVILPPRRNEPPSGSEALEHWLVQAFIPDPAIEALGEAVFPGLARCDVMPFDAVLLCPEENSAAGQLGAIVTDDAKRPAVTSHKDI